MKMEHNKLERMVATKSKSNKFFGTADLVAASKLSDKECMEQVLLISSRLIAESVEVQKECNLDFWKKDFKFDKSKVREEITDCMHIVLSMAVIAGMDAEEIFKNFQEKAMKNETRKDWKR